MCNILLNVPTTSYKAKMFISSVIRINFLPQNSFSGIRAGAYLILFCLTFEMF